MAEIFLIKQSLEQLMRDYDIQADKLEKAETAYIKGKTAFDILQAKTSITFKATADKKETATERKDRVMVALEVELVQLTMLEATFKAEETKLKAIENRKQLVRDQCKLASAETYAGHLTGQGDNVSVKARFK